MHYCNHARLRRGTPYSLLATLTLRGQRSDQPPQFCRQLSSSKAARAMSTAPDSQESFEAGGPRWPHFSDLRQCD